LATKAVSAAPKVADFTLPAPPLQLSGVSASIATLTWQVAAKENVLEKVQVELNQLAEAFNSEAVELQAWRRLATDPFVPISVRKKIVDAVLRGKASDITLRLLDSLADENALAAVPEVSLAFDELQLAHKKEVFCTIVTAQPMDKMERADIIKQASKFVDAGFKLVAKEKVDKKLVGGFVLEFEDRLVDLSTSKKVSEFNAVVSKMELEL